VFNNCQHMIASDAAQTGMNWGNATKMAHFDNLFSPMNEAQRAARVARMLEPFLNKDQAPLYEPLDRYIEKMGRATKFSEYADDKDAAISIVTDALAKLPDVREGFKRNGRGLPAEEIAELYLTERARRRLFEKRDEVEQQLRLTGRVITGAPMQRAESGEMVPQFVKPEEIVSRDVTNEVIENHLLPFEVQLLKQRRGIVDVKRLTTSAQVPQYRKEKQEYTDERGRVRTRTVETATGEFDIEYPSKAEKAVLTRGRAKEAPMEHFFRLLQTDFQPETRFDFLSGSPLGLSKFSRAPEHARSGAEAAQRRQRDRVSREAHKELRHQASAIARRAKASRRRTEAAARAAKATA
jgi:hypothetical protein